MFVSTKMMCRPSCHNLCYKYTRHAGDYSIKQKMVHSVCVQAVARGCCLKTRFAYMFASGINGHMMGNNGNPALLRNGCEILRRYFPKVYRFTSNLYDRSSYFKPWQNYLKCGFSKKILIKTYEYPSSERIKYKIPKFTSI